MERVNKKLQQESVPEQLGEKEPGSFRLIFTLGLAGFLSGLVLVSAYLFTKPIIEANKLAATEKAIYKVLPGCMSFKTLELKNGVLLEYKKSGKSTGKKGDTPQLIYAGFNKSDNMVGFAVPGAEAGFQDVIGVMIGYDALKKSIIGFEVLECKETPGLGDKITKDEHFHNNFKDLLSETEILFVKTGEKKNPNEVEGITGATISSKAVVRLLNNSMNKWKEPINVYMNSAGEPTKSDKK